MAGITITGDGMSIPIPGTSATLPVGKAGALQDAEETP